MKFIRILSLALALCIVLSSVSVAAFADSENAQMPTLTVDMSAKKHDIVHGAAGFLYGISNEGVPGVNTLTALKPKVLATKGALGTEHPYGDALDVADEFFEGGGEMVMMYNSNYYGVFGVTAPAEDYAEVLRTVIAPYVAEWKDSMREKYPDIDKRIVYIPINEGTPANLADGSYKFNQAWKLYYDAIVEGERAYYEAHGLYPAETYVKTAYIAGPNDANFRGYDEMFTYLLFCKNKDCLPDVITWHELDERDLVDMEAHKADYYRVCRELKIDPVQIVCNEYALMKDCGVPGKLVNWISRFEDNELYGCLPFWHQANNLNDLAADDNSGNGAWWVYKWYSDMSGVTLDVTSNDEYNGFYGVATIDEAKRSASVLAGGVDGNAKIVLENLGQTETFKNADRVQISVQAAYFEGYHGSVYEPATVFEGVYAVKDGKVEIDLANIQFSTGYYITVTETTDDISEPVNGAWREVYEAEDGVLSGNAIIEQMTELTISYYLSGEARVAGIREKGDGVEISVNVPVDGKYELCLLYGNGVGLDRSNRNHALKNLSVDMSIDGGKAQTIKLDNTLFYGMEDSVKIYADLEAGEHTIYICANGNEKKYYPDEEISAELYIDALYMTYAGAYGEDISTLKKFEAEAADFNRLSGDNTTLVETKTELESFSGSGYVMGLDKRTVSEGGGIRWIVNVATSGIYNLDFKYSSASAGKLNIYKDNTSLTLDNLITSIALENTDGEWKTAAASVYLAKGINIIDIDTDISASVDCMYVDISDSDYSVTVEAESGEGKFETAYSEYAEAEYVLGIIAEADPAKRESEGKYLEIKVNVPEAGFYNMQVFQSGDDLCGTHWYNIKIIDKYAVVSVNGDEGERYFFANTFSNDSFRERSVPVMLNAGENTVRFFNDDSWEVYYGGSTSEPGTDRLTNYMPNLDKFVFTPAVVETENASRENMVTIVTTYGGYVVADKNTVADGEDILLTVIPLKGEKGGTSAFKSLVVNGEEIKPTDNGDGTCSYTVKIVTDDVTVLAEFKVDKWLENAIAYAEGRLDYDFCYSEASVDALKTALEGAKTAAKKGTQTEKYQNYCSLCDAIDALVIKISNLFEDDYVGHWAFEDSAVSDTGIELTLVGRSLKPDLGSVRFAEGSLGQGIKLDGSYGLAMGELGDEFTASVWANTTSEFSTLFFKNMGDAHQQNWVGIQFENGRSKVCCHNGNDIVWKNVIYSHMYTVRQWHCYTYTEKNGIGTLYIDGVKNASGIIIEGDKEELFLGITYWSESAMNGAMDELYFYSKALTDEEVALLASGTAPELAKLDKNELVTALVKVSELNLGYYDDQQQATIKSALKNGEATYLNANASQDEINSAAKELNSALKIKGSLVPKEESDSGISPALPIAVIAISLALVLTILVSRSKRKNAK